MTKTFLFPRLIDLENLGLVDIVTNCYIRCILCLLNKLPDILTQTATLG